MSKSTGNNILPNELFSGENTILSKAISPAVARFFILQAHYRSILDFSDEAILASERGFFRLMDAVKSLTSLTPSNQSSIDIHSWKQKCYNAMNDDFNSPILIAHLFDAVKMINLIKENKETISAPDLTEFTKLINAFVFEVLGLENVEEQQGDNKKLEGVLNMLIGMRNEARANKDFALSDHIRDELLKLGIQLKDGKEGTSFLL
jgi:cysteinyl-tRNA synthetase